MKHIRKEIKKTARVIIYKNLRTVLSVSLSAILIWMIAEFIGLRFGPQTVVTANMTFRDILLNIDLRAFITVALLRIIRFLLISPLLCCICGFAIDLTSTARVLYDKNPGKGNELPDISMREVFRWYIIASERIRALKLRVLVLLLSLIWKTIFCGFPAYLILNLRGPMNAFYYNNLFTYLTGFLLGYVIAYIIEGRYYPAFFLIAQNPDIKLREALRESVTMMRGFSVEFFKYKLSFLPWYILAAATFGAGLVFVLPYRWICDAIFVRFADANGKPVWEVGGTL